MKIQAKAPIGECVTEKVRVLTLTAATQEQAKALAVLHDKLIKPGALTKILKDLADVAELRRFQMNLVQDTMENAFVEISLLDAARQALHETNPDHPFLKKPMPGFGVWESQRKRIEELERELRKQGIEIEVPEPFDEDRLEECIKEALADGDVEDAQHYVRRWAKLRTEKGPKS